MSTLLNQGPLNPEPPKPADPRYPKWGYHATKEALIIQSAEHHAKLGDGYYDTPTLLAESLKGKPNVQAPVVDLPPVPEETAQEPVDEQQPELGNVITLQEFHDEVIQPAIDKVLDDPKWDEEIPSILTGHVPDGAVAGEVVTISMPKRRGRPPKAKAE